MQPREPILDPIILEKSLSMIHAWRGTSKTNVARGTSAEIRSSIDKSLDNSSFNELKRVRKMLLNEARELIEKAQREKRDNTASETRAFDFAVALCDQWQSLLEVAERSDFDTDLDAPMRRSGKEMPGSGMSDRSGKWRTPAGKEVRVYGPRDSISRGSRSGSEFEALGFGGFVRSIVLGGNTDLERRALSEGTDGAGGYQQ